MDTTIITHHHAHAAAVLLHPSSEKTQPIIPSLSLASLLLHPPPQRPLPEEGCRAHAPEEARATHDELEQASHEPDRQADPERLEDRRKERHRDEAQREATRDEAESPSQTLGVRFPNLRTLVRRRPRHQRHQLARCDGGVVTMDRRERQSVVSCRVQASYFRRPLSADYSPCSLRG